MRLGPDVEGFLHVSELSDEPLETPDQLVGDGELITVKVAEVDLRRHRVTLTGATKDVADGPVPRTLANQPQAAWHSWRKEPGRPACQCQLTCHVTALSSEVEGLLRAGNLGPGGGAPPGSGRRAGHHTAAGQGP
ncbi:S1 RNA-binding domain-containing protein [Streptomyces sp. NPDC002523]